MAVLSLCKLLVLAAALGQAWSLAVDRILIDGGLAALEKDGIEIDSLDTAPALIPRANVGNPMAYTNIAASGAYGGGFWDQEVDPATAATVTDDEVYQAAEVSWTDAVAKAKSGNKPTASIGRALFIPSKGRILDTSLKAAGSKKQSAQTCGVVTPGMTHKNYANCAEMNALAIMQKNGWSVPETGAKMACCGNYGSSAIQAKWVKP